MKKLLLISAALVGVLGMVGCSGEDAPVDGDSPVSKGAQTASGPVGLARAGKTGASHAGSPAALRSQ